MSEKILWMKVIGIYIQCFNKDLAEKILNNKVSTDDMLDFFGKRMPVLGSDTSMLKHVVTALSGEMNKECNEVDQRQEERLDIFHTTSYLERIKSALEIIKLESMQY